MGWALPNDGGAPLAQLVGIVVGSAAYAAQSGVGAAGPTQVSCCTPFASPVLVMACAMSCDPGVFWKMPMPARTTARGMRAAPVNAPIWLAVP